MANPPKIASLILSITNRKRNRENVIGDFNEFYEDASEAYGRKYADRWYWKQVLKSIPKVISANICWGGTMFRNYIKIALRNLVKYKGYSALNIIGLAVGIACSIMIMLWVFHELSFDGFNSKADRTYRILQKIKYEEVVTWAIHQGPVAPALKDNLPEIEDFTRICYGNWRATYNNKTISRVGLYVDPGFFNIFDYGIVKGNPESIFENPNTVMLGESYARDIFGNEDPVNKILTLYEMYDVKVVGIIKDSPDNSHLKFGFISNLDLAKKIGYTVDKWDNNSFGAYLLLKDGVDFKHVEEKIYNFLDDKPTPEEWEKLTLQPLNDIHFSSEIGFDQSITIDYQYVVIFSIAAFFILLIAAINFINLSTARAELRSKEIGLRKVIGAAKSQLVKQFLGESILVTFIASIIGLLLVVVLLPYFNQISGKSFNADYIFSKDILSRLIIIIFATALLSGVYPAFMLSSFLPSTVLKGISSSGSRSLLLRKSLVIFQFGISSFLIIGTIVVFSQLNYLRNKPLGYDKDNIIYFYLSEKYADSYDAFKNEIMKSDKVIDICKSSTIPYYGITFTNAHWLWVGSEGGNPDLISATYIDNNYFKTYRIDIIEGRGFSSEYLSDSSAVVLNETAVKLMGLKNPVGSTIYYDDNEENIPFNVIGVCKDYHYKSLHSSVDPLIHLYADSGLYGVSIRMSANNTSETLKYIENSLKSVIPGSVFDFRFLNRTLNYLYRTEERIGNIMIGFAVLAIMISAMGLLGLASFTVTKRKKEIGIRKVLGATVRQVILVLIKDYSKWIIVANLLAYPLSYYVLESWLNNFPYRAELSIMVFVISGILTLSVAFVCVILQTLKAALLNPTESLKYE